MGKIAKRAALLLLTSLAVLFATYLVFRAVAAARQGYSWSEMDWNSDGSTSIIEFFESSDIGKRTVAEGGRTCVDYYAYKDGSTVKQKCK